MPRPCSTCQHIRRPDIDRRLAAGEPTKRIARDYSLNPSSLHRHRTNCIGLAPSGTTMKEVSQGTAALATLPSRDELGSAYRDLQARIDETVQQAQSAGSLAVAIQGLNALRQSLDSLARIAGHDRPVTSEVKVDVSVQVNDAVNAVLAAIGHQPSDHHITALEKIVDGETLDAGVIDADGQDTRQTSEPADGVVAGSSGGELSDGVMGQATGGQR